MVALWLSSCLASLAVLARDVERVQVFRVRGSGGMTIPLRPPWLSVCLATLAIFVFNVFA